MEQRKPQPRDAKVEQIASPDDLRAKCCGWHAPLASSSRVRCAPRGQRGSQLALCIVCTCKSVFPFKAARVNLSEGVGLAHFCNERVQRGLRGHLQSSRKWEGSGFRITKGVAYTRFHYIDGEIQKFPFVQGNGKSATLESAVHGKRFKGQKHMRPKQ